MKYNCETCDYHTDKKTLWYQHKRTQRHKVNNPNEEDKESKYFCDICDYQLKSSSSFSHHLKSKKHIMNIEREEKESITNQYNITNNNITNIHNDNSQNINIHIHCLGQEDLSLTMNKLKFIKNIEEKNPMEALKLLFDEIMFREENRNISEPDYKNSMIKCLTKSGEMFLKMKQVTDKKVEMLANHIPIPNGRGTMAFDNIERIRQVNKVGIERPLMKFANKDDYEEELKYYLDLRKELEKYQEVVDNYIFKLCVD